MCYTAGMALHRQTWYLLSILKGAGHRPMSTNRPVLRMLTKKQCSLCDEAVEDLWTIPGIKERLELVPVNILQEGNEDMFDLYRYEIPVFFLGNKFVSKNKLDKEKLLQVLEDHDTSCGKKSR